MRFLQVKTDLAYSLITNLQMLKLACMELSHPMEHSALEHVRKAQDVFCKVRSGDKTAARVVDDLLSDFSRQWERQEESRLMFMIVFECKKTMRLLSDYLT